MFYSTHRAAVLLDKLSQCVHLLTTVNIPRCAQFVFNLVKWTGQAGQGGAGGGKYRKPNAKEVRGKRRSCGRGNWSRELKSVECCWTSKNFMTLRTSDESQQQEGRVCRQREREREGKGRKRATKKKLKNANTIITSAGNVESSSSRRGQWTKKKITTQPGSVSMGVCVCECVLTNNVGHNTHTHSHTHFPGSKWPHNH